MMNTFKVSLIQNKLSGSPLSQTISFNPHMESKLISSQVHDQKDSYLCWAFAICTMIASELRFLVVTLFSKHKINKQTKEKLLIEIEKMNKTGKFRNELVLLVAPRSPKLSGDVNYDFEKQASSVLSALEKICYRSVIQIEGWKMLPSIVNIFKVLE